MSIPLDVPVGWSDPPSVDLFHAIVLLGGIPLVVSLVITLAVYLPAIVRGERVAPGQPPMEDQWIGGPRTGPAELASGDGATASGSSSGTDTGGASGRW